MATTRLIFFPNKLKKSKKTGKIPMYLRVLHNGNKAESRLNAEIDEKDLVYWNERAMSFEQRDSRINMRIYSMKNDFEKFESLNNYKLTNFTAKNIVELLTGKNKSEDKIIPSAVEYLRTYFQNHVINSKTYAYNTVKTYRKAINHFNNFVRINNINNITLEEFDHSKAQEFKTYLTSDYAPLLKKAMTDVSASTVICKLKAIFGNALDSELIRKNPFSKIKLSTLSIPKPRLTVEELALIYNLDLAEFPSLDIYRDIFLFSCFTGLSYNDVCRLNRDVLTKSEKGLKLESYRGKTKIPIIQLLVSYAEIMLTKYTDNPQVKIKNTLLPPRSMTQVNIHIKILAEMCKIKKKLSTSVARCTCMQLLVEAEVREGIVTDRIMGWSSAKNIASKYYGINETFLNDSKQKFEVYLDKYFK
jgi:site-specific recombinase XerD